MIRTFIMAAALCLAVADQGWAKTVIARGPIGVGTTDSGIDDLRSGCCAFLTDSRIAKTIFSKCGFLDECEIIGTVEKLQGFEVYFFTSISRVRKIDTSKEPPNEVIKQAACWATSIDKNACDDASDFMSLTIKSRRSFKKGKSISWHFKFDMQISQTIHRKAIFVNNIRVAITRNNNEWTYQKL